MTKSRVDERKAAREPSKPPYNADMVAGALLERESRIIAKLLLDGVGQDSWRERLLQDNPLQKRSLKTILRQAGLVRNRLDLLDAAGWRLIVRGASDTVRQLLLAACIKHNRLLGDYLLTVVREHIRLFEKTLNPRAWSTYIEELAHRASVVATWSPSTKRKLGQVTHKILAEAGIIDNSRSRKFIPFFLSPEVGSYLENRDETYILKCLELT
ncbi:MAG TPA: DUF1819 family protein [Candidatus Ozemobacteraceae bacterium]|nr:DUF1819 family protein [Candidatus Ozemobacteraceae bacterium]